MRGRLLLLLVLSALLLWLQAFPRGAIPAASASDMLVWIDLRAMSLTLYQNEERIGSWPIAGGTAATPTPVGVFRVTRRFMPEGNGFGTRFLGLNVPWGQFGIHGTNRPGSIGSLASHGCIRMFNRDIEALYRLVPNWTRVVIEDGPYGALGWSLRTLTPASRGAQVRAAQERLRQLGYYEGSADGIYGAGTTAAVRRLREDKGLPRGDTIDQAVWDAMGVMLFE